MKDVAKNVAQIAASNTLGEYFDNKLMNKNTCDLSIEDDLEALKLGFLSTTGWIDSLKMKQCLDANGKFVPWYNYCVINFLKKRLLKNMSVFEFGCGYSTLFYAMRCKKVVSAELNSEWRDKIMEIANGMRIDNIEINISDSNSFCMSLEKHASETFDLFVIDSKDRALCMNECVKRSTPNSVIILDNSERSGYSQIFESMTNLGWKHIEFCGLGPLKNKESCTSIFYQSSNVFKI